MCAACAHRGSLTGDDPFRGVPEASRAAAERLEREGDLSRSLFLWKVVRDFLPADPEAARRIESLEGRIRTEADRHYRKGVEYFEGRSFSAARREFLAALAVDPGHAKALGYLMGRMSAPVLLSHETEEGDSARSVAAAVYGDPEKEFLVAYFGDAGAGGFLAPGRRLKLPRLETPEGFPRENSRRAAGMGSGDPAEKSPRKSAVRRGLSTNGEPADEGADEARNAANYRIGTAHYRQKEYRESLKALKTVDIGYRDTKDLLVGIENILHEADKHYAEGVRRFVQQDPEGALREWETTLRLDPGHPQAGKDIEKARRLNEKIKTLP